MEKIKNFGRIIVEKVNKFKESIGMEKIGVIKMIVELFAFLVAYAVAFHYFPLTMIIATVSGLLLMIAGVFYFDYKIK